MCGLNYGIPNQGGCMNKVSFALLFTVGLLVNSAFAADSYKIDPAHTTFGFTAKHMMISNVSGQFDKYDGTIVYDPKDLVNSQINVTIDASSIDTRNAKRDDHLRSGDFFETEKYPTMTFVSKRITASEIVGDLTMKGVTKEVSIPATIAGPIKTPMGNAIGITGTFTLNRQDYGVSFNKVLDQGGMAVSNDIVVTISAEATKAEDNTKK